MSAKMHLISAFLLLFILTEVLTASQRAKDKSRRTYKSNRSMTMKLCPRNEEESVLREYYHNETKQCYPAMEQGPCGTFMLFYQQSENSEYGVCSCINDKVGTSCRTKMMRPVARWNRDNQCYLLYDQGPCKSGEWFTLNRIGHSVCRPNPCENMMEPQVNLNAWLHVTRNNNKTFENLFQSADLRIPRSKHLWEVSKPFWFLNNGTCFKSFTQGPCPVDKIFVFKGTSFKPTCVNPFKLPPCNRGTTTSGLINCARQSGDDCAPEPTIAD